MFDYCWSFEKASLSVRILKRDVSFKISDVKICQRKLRVSEGFFWVLKREGWEINDLSPLSWQFFENLWPLGCFQRFKSFETKLSFKKTQISQFWYHEMFVLFWILSFAKDVLFRKLIVFSCLQFADCYIWSRILSCGVVFVLNHFYGIFSLKSFLWNDMVSWNVLGSKFWCCRKHVFVFEIVSLKDLNKFDQIIFFPVTFG